MSRRLLILAGFVVLFMPGAATMQTKIPEFNPVCWKAKACCSARAQIRGEDGRFCDQANNEQLSDGWVKDARECPGTDWGRCLPAMISNTEIAFGGKRSFLHLGEFIQTIYKYAITVAGILSVVMIIVAGFQRVTSGGNSEMISSSNKRIVGALVGLFIAYTSYFILNTINPALINLRLPQVWMIRPQNLVPKFCSAAPSSTVFSFAADVKDQKSKPTSVPNFDGSDALKYADLSTAKGACGHRFFMKEGGDSTCFGNFCKTGEICINFYLNGVSPYHCEPGVMSGAVGGSVGGFSGVQIDNDLELYVMCANGKIEQIQKEDLNTEVKPQRYIIHKPSQAINDYCGGEQNIVGYYLGVEGNDERGGTGRLVEAAPFSAGYDDWYAVGREPGTHTCDVNLGFKAFSVLADQAFSNAADYKQKMIATGVQYIYACSFLTYTQKEYIFFGSSTFPPLLAKNTNFTKYLITLDELKNGFQCDIIMDRGNFPALDNANHPNNPMDLRLDWTSCSTFKP